MKINEIFDTTNKERTVNDITNYDRDYWSNRQGEIDRGKFSSVLPKKSDPHMVRKIPNKAESELENDAYYVYMNTIVEQKIAQSNPFAPRVYRINRLKSATGKKYTIEMERLIPIDDIDADELREYGERLFGTPEEDYDYAETWYFADKISEIQKYGRKSNDENLNSLMDIISNIMKVHLQFLEDIHDGNIMFRRGKTGIQLVITDPLAQQTH